jgi:hypothetical protein
MSSTGRGAERAAGDYYRTPAWCVEALLPDLALDNIQCVIDPGCGDGAIGDVLYQQEWASGALFAGIELDPHHHEALKSSGTYDHVHSGSYLLWTPPPSWPQPLLIIGNPPYSDAMPFVQHSLGLAAGEGTVAMLLRLAWLASQGRADFHRANPSDVYILPRRPSFCWVHTYKVFCKGCHVRGKIFDSVRTGQRALTSPQIAKRPCTDMRGRPPAVECEGDLQLLDTTTTTTDSCDYAWFVWGPGRGGWWRIL